MSPSSGGGGGNAERSSPARSATTSSPNNGGGGGSAATLSSADVMLSKVGLAEADGLRGFGRGTTGCGETGRNGSHVGDKIGERVNILVAGHGG